MKRCTRGQVDERMSERMMDASGNILNSYTYDQFGAILEQTEGTYNPFKYCGELQDMPDNF